MAQIASHSTESITIDPATLPDFDGKPEIKELDDSGKTLRSDRFREDGSRFFSYRLGSENEAKSVAIFDARGRAIAQWNEQHELYFAWFDWLIGSEQAIIINDGPPLARYLHKYQRENVVLVQTIHSKHSADPTKRSERLGWTYTPALKNVDRFDLFAVLTQSQHSDLTDLNFVVDNAAVLPNMTAATPMRRIKPRTPGTGVMLARTTFLKRIDHAITAVHRARQSGTDATLDIYGVADEAQESLEALVEDLDTNGAIALRGFDPRAKQKFEKASFTLLTSEYEGQPLVLLESMAAGCIPISYNIKYGPADIITDGVDGFLVPDGDIDAMARRIKDIHTMDDQKLMQMRQAAIRRVSDFSPEKITQLWGAALTRAVANKQRPAEIDGNARLSSISVTGRVLSLQVILIGDALYSPDWALLTWTERKGGRFGRLPARLEQINGETHVVTTAHADDFAAVDHGHIDFWVDLRVAGHPCRLRIKGADDVEPHRLGHLELYPTRFGSLSIRFPTVSQEGEK
ncbi:glycosyltransferase [Brevibacterium atlanticum]|uniref:glycosyltransferase n=1 Tax=Brevibacterium atlanticum TaxID=2697563 RepID=UPI001420C2C3|nr:glycosyltransferase [Brevibacterium atlanticum]